MEGFLSGTLKDELIKNYRDDLDFQNLIDQVQKVSASLIFIILHKTLIMIGTI